MVAGLLGLKEGQTRDQVPDELIAAVSPITYVSPEDPPVLTCQGEADALVIPDHAIILDKTLREAGVESKLVLVKGARHDVARYPETKEAVLDFVKERLLGVKETAKGSTTRAERK